MIGHTVHMLIFLFLFIFFAGFAPPPMLTSRLAQADDKENFDFPVVESQRKLTKLTALQMICRHC